MCAYCECENPLNSLADERLFDYDVDFGSLGKVSFGAVISPEQREMEITVMASPVAYKELLVERLQVKYCPMCGRKL